MECIRVPSLAENVTEATVGPWIVKEGETVQKGDEVVELITEKAEFTLEAEVEGVVTACLVPEKSVLPVGCILCVLNGTEAEVALARQENERRLEAHTESPMLWAETVQMEAVEEIRPKGRTRATPVARRLAKEAGVELSVIAEAQGVDGVVKEEHVQAYLKDRA